MASGAFSGVGTKFQRSNMAATPVFTSIAEINSIDGPNKSRSTIDVTSLDSDGGYKEFITSFRDAGEIQLDMNFTPDGFNALNDDFESEELVDYRIVLPNTAETTFDFSGIVTSLGMSVPMEDKVTTKVTIKISGPVALTT
jgi:predicted secreted protein